MRRKLWVWLQLQCASLAKPAPRTCSEALGYVVIELVSMVGSIFSWALRNPINCYLRTLHTVPIFFFK